MAFLWRFIVILAEFKPTLAIFYDMWQIFIFANGLIWKNHLTIWSHWSLHFLQKHFYAINFPPKCVDGDAKKYFRLINLLHTRDVASVWPDVGMKSSQIVSKSCPKVLLHKSDLFENSPNHPHIFWVTFVVYFSPRTLKNRPIWSHCQWCTLLFEPSINADASFALVWRSPLRSSNLCTLSCLILSLSHGYSVTLPCLTLSCFILSLYHLNSSTLLSTIFLSTMF